MTLGEKISRKVMTGEISEDKIVHTYDEQILDLLIRTQELESKKIGGSNFKDFISGILMGSVNYRNADWSLCCRTVIGRKISSKSYKSKKY